MQKRIFQDQLNRKVEINLPPQRIISLVPSQTELLFDLGLTHEIVGITKFCIHPKDKFKSTTKIGGTKKLDIEKIRSLKPNLIIGNKEENQKGDIELLMQEFPVWMSDIFNLEDALLMIKSIGSLVNKEKESLSMVKQIRNDFEDLKLNESKEKVAYFIWKDPNMLAGKQTFINEMLTCAGFENVVDLERYPEFSLEELKILNPEMVMLSSEPYPFKQKHLEEFQKIWPKASIKLVDGEMFSWYGSKLLKSAAYIKSLV